MTAKQLSVFIENRQGRLGEVLHVLKANNVNILSISLADTTEYGLLRLIVNKPEHARDVLLRAGFSSMLTEVLIIKVPHVAGSLQSILELVAKENVNIEYMYGLSVEAEDASIVMKTNDLDVACRVLRDGNISTMTSEEIAAL
ncbi:MAG: amino acid-binding protein [Clostridia bacterium]|nr:amino acid-binding protein [Clostridia bacterium]